MHKIDKFLARLDANQRKKVLAIVERLDRSDLTGLDVRKLQGFPGLYRVRVGRIRVKFVMDISGIRILSIGHRSESTYRDV
ncbi:hypothetical protein A3G63_01100 [Candidatus Kaiserbacteria bacterium RIFCSPLOWO2_12_FULL_52_8]|nr:MAG: hypothetical protein A3G63_01100 [Candidatus Kaiserbacteria bacterium RIFCSPLOWO2_12_FULL_52_8]